jgi:hypothetical protein
MCIALIILNLNEKFPLIVFHNRDVMDDVYSTEGELDLETNIYQGKVIRSVTKFFIAYLLNREEPGLEYPKIMEILLLY